MYLAMGRKLEARLADKSHRPKTEALQGITKWNLCDDSPYIIHDPWNQSGHFEFFEKKEEEKKKKKK